MSRITINQLPEPVKRGQIQPKDYWNDDYFKQLEPLVAALKEAVPDAKYDGKALVFLLVQLLNFQDQALGREAMPPKVCPKLPIKLVTDPSVGGALHAIALKVYDIRRQRGLKAIEWQNPGKRKECTEVFQVLRRELERRDLLQPPRVFISPGCDSEVQRLREYVRRLQGQLVESPDEQGVTHMVYPFGPRGDPDDGKEYTTLLGIKGIQARVHYWYQPDSYDAWIQLHMVDNKEVVPERKPPGGVWKVTPRWIIDSERYNEWMNPADYTTPEMDAEMEAAEAADKGTKRAGSSLAGQSKKARGDTGPEVAAEPLEVLGPTARLRQVLQPLKALQADTALSVDNLSMGQINNHLSAYKPPLPPQAPAPAAEAAAAGAGGDTAADAPAGTAAGTAAANEVAAPAADDAAAAQRQQQQPPGRPPPARSRPFGGIVSAAAAWFKPNALHPLERAALPEYFSGKNAETGVKLYRDHRDAMLALFWENPERDLTFAEVRQHIDGEVNGLMRVYEFLQGWGLINSSQGKNGMDMTLLLGPGVAARMAPGTSALYSFKKPSRLEATAAAQAGGPYGKAAESAARGDGTRLLHPVAGRKGAEEGLDPSCLTHIFCSAMPWVDCTRLRYHCTNMPDINLCPQAFAEGRFPPGVSSRDFVRSDDSKRHTSTDGWTPEETTLLLEAVELYKEDWERVASHVGKSQSACLARFVRIPIEELYLDDVLDWTETLERSQQQQQQKLPPLPFLDEPNPLMATLGALSTILGPKVAAAAAQASLQALAEQDLTAGAVLDPQVRLAAVTAAGKQAAAANGQLRGEDSMNGIEAHTADQQQQQQQPADPSQPIDKQLMTSAVASGLAAAATRAKLLAMAEEREIQRLMVGLVHDAAKRVDAKVNLLMQLADPQGLDRERATIEGTLKSLASDRTAAAAQLVTARARKKQQDEAAAAAKAKTEAMKKQQAEAAARHKAAAAAAAQQQQQQQQQQQAAAAAAAGKPPAGSSPALQQQQQQQQQQGLVAPPAAAPPSTQAGGPVGVPGGAAAGGLGQQQLQQVQQQAQTLMQQQMQVQMQQQMQQQQQQQHTPAKSNVSMDSRGAGADSGMLDDDDDDDLGELLDDIDGDGDMMLAGSGDEEMDMP